MQRLEQRSAGQTQCKPLSMRLTCAMHLQEAQEAAIPAPSANELPDHPQPDLSAFPAAMTPEGAQQPPDTTTAAMLLSQHLQNAAQSRAVAPDGTPLETPVVPVAGGEGGAEGAEAEAAAAAAAAAASADLGGSPGEGAEASTKYTGVRRNKGGRFSARIKLGGTNKCAR
jgi:hypothetical protein